MAKKVALVFGIVFILLGVLGFISNPIVGRDGFFHTDMGHDIVHLISGVLLLVVMGKEGWASMMLKVLGVVYLLVTILGFVMGEGTMLGFMEINGVDNWLHLVLAVVFLWVGFMSKPAGAVTPSNPVSPMRPQM